MRNDSGFTLVEVMTAMAIAAVAATAVVVAMPPAIPETETAARNLASSLARAQRAAVTQGAPVGLILSGSGWEFAAWDGDAWRDLDRLSGFAPGAWPEGALAVLESETSSEEDLPEGFPSVVFDETGGASPFTLRIDGRDASATVRGDAAGEIAVEAADG